MFRLLLIAFLIPSLFLSKPGFAQTTEKEKQRQEYLEEWKSKRTTGWMLLGMGVPVFLVGSSMVFSGDGGAGGVLLMAIGAGATIASFPVFYSAKKNKRKAAELSLIPSSIQVPHFTYRSRNHAGIKLTIAL